MHKFVSRFLGLGLVGLPLLASAATASAEINFNAADESALPDAVRHRAIRKWTPTDEVEQARPAGNWTNDAGSSRVQTDDPWSAGLLSAPLWNEGMHWGSYVEYHPVFPVVSGVPPATAATMATSGTLSTTVSAPYSTAGWAITTGDSTYPDLGGVATFNEQVGTTPGVAPGGNTITLDVGVTLSGLTFNGVFQYTLAAGSGGSLSLTTTGTNTLNVPLSTFSSPTLLATGDTLSAPIGGGGTFGLTKTGAGTITLSGTNTYTGGTFITGGALRITNGDATLGTTGSGNDVTLDGGTLRVLTTALTSARNFTLNSGGGTLQLATTGSTLSGVIGGTGNLTITSNGGLTLSGANTYTGSTTVQSNAPLTLTGTGTLSTTSGLDLTGTLALSDATTNVNNRLGTVPITTRGATITLAGNASAATTQTSGALNVASGNTTITIVPAAGGVDAFNPASITRSNNATLFVRGTSLGAAAAASVAQINPTTGPAMVGGGGMAGTSTISIVPWMVGNGSATALVSSSLVTVGANGLRPLNLTTEYGSSLATSTSTTNVRLTTTTAATVPAGGASVNALVLSTTGASALTSTNGGVLSIASGALLYSPSSNAAGTISANLNFGTAEGIISSSNINTAVTLSGTIAGTGGLTLNAFGNTTPQTSGGNFVLGATANTYTGTTTLLNGLTTFSGTITNDGVTPSAFGEGTSAIVLNVGAVGARLYSSATGAIINRDLLVTGTASTVPTGTAGLGTVDAYPLTVNGAITLNRPLNLEGGTTAANVLTLNGPISGAGYLADSSSSYNALNGNNTFTGGINVGGGTYVAGTDTAFGTGTIYGTTSAGTILSGQGNAATAPAVRTLANPFVFANGSAVSFTFGGTIPLNLTGSINLNGPTQLAVTTGGGTTMSGTVSNGMLSKVGAGTLTLASPTGNTYTGGTKVSAGTLLVTNTSGSATGSGAISLSAGTLGGTGFIVNNVPAGSTAATTSIASGAIIQGGTGSSVGALTLTGNLTLVSGSIIELGLAANGTNSSLTRGDGVWTLPSGIRFTFTGSPTVGQTYNNLLTGLAGDPGTEAGWTVTNNGFTGKFIYDGAGDIDLTMTSVPEPATVLGGALTAGLLGWRLRRRVRRG